METRPALAVPIDAVEHQAVQMNIQIGGGAEALDERDRARVGLAAFQSRLLPRKSFPVNPESRFIHVDMQFHPG